MSASAIGPPSVGGQWRKVAILATSDIFSLGTFNNGGTDRSHSLSAIDLPLEKPRWQVLTRAFRGIDIEPTPFLVFDRVIVLFGVEQAGVEPGTDDCPTLPLVLIGIVLLHYRPDCPILRGGSV